MTISNERGGTRSETQVVPDEETEIIRLIGSPEPEHQTGERPQVRWSEDTIDNEHMNKKKSKICCIFHPKTEFGESEEEEEEDYSSSSDSSSDSDSDSNSDSGKHKKDSCCSSRHKNRRVRPNAYERQTLKKKTTQ